MVTSSTAEEEASRLEGVVAALEALSAPVLLVSPEADVVAANGPAYKRFGPALAEGLAQCFNLREESLRSRFEPVFRSSMSALLRLDPPGGDPLTFSARRLPGWRGRSLALLELRDGDSLARRFLAAQELLHRHERRLDDSLRQQERLRSEAARLQLLSATDRMTGLLNATEFTERALRLLDGLPANDSAATFLYVDLNNFKPVNDTYGHDAGDHILRHCAGALRATLREGDLVGRLGGDEFGVMLAEAGPRETRRILERLKEAITAPVQWRDPETGTPYVLSVTAAVGSARAPQDGADLDSLRRAAEASMYRDKRATSGPRRVTG